jgi:hypothetical protein
MNLSCTVASELRVFVIRACGMSAHIVAVTLVNRLVSSVPDNIEG